MIGSFEKPFIRFLSSKTREGISQVNRTNNFLKPSQINSKNKSNYQYCLDLVRKIDYEGYLTTLLISEPKVRRSLIIIRALNAEVATIRENVTFKETGYGRLTFWKNSIEKYCNGINPLPFHPIIQELAKEIYLTDPLSKRWFLNLVESRERTISDSPFLDTEELEKYSDNSVTPIFLLAFNIMGIRSHHIDHASSHFGKSIGITNFIRSIPHEAKKRRVLIPHSLLVKHDLSQEDIIKFNKEEKIRNLVFEIASIAVQHYNHAKSLDSLILQDLSKVKIEKNTSPTSLFMGALPSKFYLERLEKYDFNPFHGKLTRRYAVLPFRLLFNKLRKRYYQ